MKLYKAEIDDVKEFDLKQTFTCGQCFRWHENADSSYTGVIKDGVLNIYKVDDKVTIYGIFDDKLGQSKFEEVVKDYLDLKRDYGKIQKAISQDDENLKKAIEYGKGIRILKQDSWEMLISFITSACNNIPRISKTIENMSKKFGKRVELSTKSDIANLNGVFYLFPTPEELGKATMEELRECNLGFRDKYVFEVTKKVLSNELDLNSLNDAEYEKAKKELLKINGVGSKVADCILLFAYSIFEAFPVDTWVKKIMNELYVDSQNVKKIEEYAHRRFGEYAGIAQQYLFYYKREQ